MRVVNLGDTLVVKGETFPSPKLTLVDDEGTSLATNYTAKLELIAPSGVSSIRDGVLEEPSGEDPYWTFEWLPADTAAPVRYRTMLRFTPIDSAEPVAPMFGPGYQVYDPLALWADPSDVAVMVGADFTQTEIVQAILFAQIVVGAWVSSVVQSPVPEAIRQATALLAARALTTAADQAAFNIGNHHDRVISETIADYTVRYADDGGAWIVGGIADLLERFTGNRIHSMHVGPATPRRPLPITVSPHVVSDGHWWELDAYDPNEDV